MGRNEGKNEKCISQSLHHLFIKKINENHKKNSKLDRVSWTQCAINGLTIKQIYVISRMRITQIIYNKKTIANLFTNVFIYFTTLKCVSFMLLAHFQ